MDEFLKQLNLDAEQIRHLPLYYRKIYYNRLAPLSEEMRMLHFNPAAGVNQVTLSFPRRAISKTINHKIFSKDEKQ